jgi:uncharacterized membrane protein
MTSVATLRGAHFAAAASLGALILLCLAWELWLAPLRPGGSWLALKVLPLLWIAPGIFRGHLYTFRAATMLILAYVAEGTVRAYAETGTSGNLAWLEVALSTAFFVSAIAYIRARRAAKSASPA